MTAIAIDDEPIALEVIKSLSAKVSFLDLKACFTNAIEGISYLQENKTDVLFLDIRMPDISGIEVSRSLQTMPMIIFTTAYSEHAVEGFELDAIDYLLKPFSLQRFLKACTKAYQLYLQKIDKNTQEAFFFLKDGYEQIRVFFHDIKYIEAKGNYLNVMLTDGKIVTRLTLNDIYERLPTQNFTRIHRSFIVANDKVTKFNKQSVFIDDIEIPIGAAYQFIA
mgnify:CR=1 FL=1